MVAQSSEVTSSAVQSLEEVSLAAPSWAPQSVPHPTRYDQSPPSSPEKTATPNSLHSPSPDSTQALSSQLEPPHADRGSFQDTTPPAVVSCPQSPRCSRDPRWSACLLLSLSFPTHSDTPQHPCGRTARSDPNRSPAGRRTMKRQEGRSTPALP